MSWKTSRAAGAVLALYAKGMSTRDISGFILEMYAMEISATEISHITDCVIPMLNEWRTRPLEAVYPFVFLDCIPGMGRPVQGARKRHGQVQSDLQHLGRQQGREERASRGLCIRERGGKILRGRPCGYQFLQT